MIKLQTHSSLSREARGSLELPDGLTVQECLDRAGVTQSARVWLNESELPKEAWPRVRPKSTTLVQVVVRPAGGEAIGGKGGLRTVLTLLTAVGSQILPGLVGAGGVFGGVIRTAAFFLGQLAIFSLIKPPSKEEPGKLPSITGTRNRAQPYEGLTVSYGQVRMFPPLAAVPVTEIEGNDQYIKLLFCLGYKPLRATELKIGEIPIERFEGVEIARATGIEYGRTGIDSGTTEVLELYSGGRDVQETILDRHIEFTATWDLIPEGRVIRENQPPPTTYRGVNQKIITFVTQQDSTRIGIDIAFPDGLYRADSQGSVIGSDRVDLSVRYRPVGATGNDWTYVVPWWSQEIMEQEFRTVQDADWFQTLQRINVALDEVVASLNATAQAQRVISAGMREWWIRRQERLGRVIIEGLDDPGVTGTLREEMQGTQSRILEIADLIDSAATANEDLAADTESFNNILSGAIAVIEFVDAALRTRQYIADGFGPELRTLPPFIQFIVRRRNLDDLFGSPPPGSFVVVNEFRQKGLFRIGFSWPVLPGHYEVQVRRTNEERTGDPKRFDKVHLYAYRSWRDVSPINPSISGDLALIALRIKATDQLNNSLDQFNCIVRKPLSWHDGEEWQTPSLSSSVYRNPAWVYADMLRGPGVMKPVSDERIDIPKLVEFAQWCATEGLRFDGLIDRQQPLEEAWSSVLRNGLASPHVRDGRFSVVWDHPQTVPVAVITPRNSANFQAGKSLRPVTQAIRIQYTNIAAGYAPDEWIVYADGFGDPTRTVEFAGYFDGGGASLTMPYSVETLVEVYDMVDEVALNIFDVEVDGQELILQGGWPEGERRWRVVYEYFPAAPDSDRVESINLASSVADAPIESSPHTGMVYRLGRYMLAVTRLRPEVFTVDQDWESLRFERGDLVHLRHDAALIGLGSARIVSLETNESDAVTEVVVDDRVTLEADKEYQAQIRLADGTLTLGSMVTEAGSSYVIEFDPAVDAEIGPGDLIVWGERERVVTPCIVHAIRPGNDLRAEVVLVAENRAIHDAHISTIPEFDPGITIPPDPDLPRPPAPRIESVQTDERVLVRAPDGTLEARIVLALNLPPGETPGERLAAERVVAIDAQFRLSGAVVSLSNNAVVMTPGSGVWESVPEYSKDLSRVSIPGVQDGERYDVRVRSITLSGVRSDWTTAPSILVVGRTTPPPDVTRLRYHRGELSWDFEAPLDHDGFLVRQFLGTGASWEAARPVHEGVIRENRVAVPIINGGVRTWLVKAVDVAGIQSLNAARLVLTDQGDTLVQNVVEEEDHRALGWPDERENMTGGVDEDLEEDAGNKPGFYRSPDGTVPFYHGNFYQTAYPGCSYTAYAEVEDEDLLPCSIGLNLKASGDVWITETKHDGGLIWPADMTEAFWPADLEQELWPRSMQWQPYEGIEDAEADVEYAFRVRALPSDSQFVIEALTILKDVPDVVEKISGFEVADTGTVRLPIRKTYREIVAVALQVQSATMKSAQLVDRDTTGPSVVVLDENGDRVTGTVDAIVQGY